MKTKPNLTPSKEDVGAPKDELRSRSDFKILRGVEASSFDIVSVDVFDTLLLRKPVSERHRQFRIAQRFTELAEAHGCEISVQPSVIWWARRQIQQAAYATRRILKHDGEVRLLDVLRRTAQLLSLSEELVELMARAELDIERQSVVANQKLVADLKVLRAAGKRIIAVSDTPLTADAVRLLIDHVVGTGLIDAVYSSTDENATKRHGTLFAKVLEAEGLVGSQVCHIGDDPIADWQMAKRCGISAFKIRRSRLRGLLRRLDGALFEMKRRLSCPNDIQASKGKWATTAERYGYEVFGPIVTQASILLWAHLSEVARERNPVALYCARGGLRIRFFFEQVANQLGLPVPIDQRDLMVSRLVAARAAFSVGSDSATREVIRLFAGNSTRVAMEAFAGTRRELPSTWDQSITADRLTVLLDTDEGSHFHRLIAEKNELFRRHVNQCVEGFDSVTLVDTGIYGITLQLLMDAFPEQDWQMLHLARSRDSRGDAPHFSHLAGILVSRDGHSPFDRNSVILRYWHLLESLFEPDLPSVEEFEVDGYAVKSNLEMEGWQQKVADADSPFVKGILQYIADLDAQNIDQQPERSDRAWRRLRRNILFPHESDVELLDIGTRSWNFGRADSHPIIASPKNLSLSEKMRNLWESPWSEGYAVRAFPRSYSLFHFGMRVGFMLRYLVRLANSRR